MKLFNKSRCRTLHNVFSDYGAGPHIVPLSGGYDSRIILAMLLKLGLKDQIKTVTFGTPGTFDYEIGSNIAKQLDIEHHKIDLSSFIFQKRDLDNFMRNSDAWIWPFDTFFNSLINTKFGDDVTYWRGFLGETLAGAFYPEKESESWDEAKLKFSTMSNFSKLIKITPSDYSPENSLSNKPFVPKEQISYDEQIAIIYNNWYWKKNLSSFNKSNFNYPLSPPRLGQFHTIYSSTISKKSLSL